VGDWTLVERVDHSKQWRYRERPVYTNAQDKPGETSGDGVEGAWHVVVP
jgi:predicted lipoprotein with Yx(FWY)xxD motif